jgi:hypothetical protein
MLIPVFLSSGMRLNKLDLSKVSTKFTIPMYFLHGIYNYYYDLSYDYFMHNKGTWKGILFTKRINT